MDDEAEHEPLSPEIEELADATKRLTKVLTEVQRRVTRLEARNRATTLVVEQLFLTAARTDPDAAAFLRNQYEGAMARLDVMDGAPADAKQTEAVRSRLLQLFATWEKLLQG